MVFGGDELQGINNLSIAALAKQELGGLTKTDDRHTSHRHGKDKRPVGEPHITPAGIRMPVARHARFGRETGTRVVRQESPGKEARNQLTDPPPSCHESQQPLVLRRKIFEENSGV